MGEYRPRVLHIQKRMSLCTATASLCAQGSDAIGTWDSQRPSSTYFMDGLSHGREAPASDSDEEEVVESRLRIHAPAAAAAPKRSLPEPLADVSHKTAGLDLEGHPGPWELSSEHPGRAVLNSCGRSGNLPEDTVPPSHPHSSC